MGRRIKDWALFRLVPLLASWIIRALRLTIRAEFVGEEIPASFWKRSEPVILAFWHDQLLLMVKGYRGPGARILISASKDGELIARTMEQFGQGAVRGSSSRGGKAAFREMMDLARQPFDLVFTPDGPKGPRHEVKMGVVQLARLTGRPVIPMAFACSRGHRFSSWDRFLLPFPFSRGVYSFGEPLTYEKTETAEQFRKRLQTAMEENVDKARQRLEVHGVSAV
ncbi:MAG: lysophospholipid acyltransferase family protein [Desulfuromonadales bacterium]|nr:lysophospholipid acyltransferase family protein [Desulfuromonadales bacterium]NIS43336.1 lysophospholipid acyltransferase family protein [Desulfuromonadales bacterium]